LKFPPSVTEQIMAHPLERHPARRLSQAAAWIVAGMLAACGSSDWFGQPDPAATYDVIPLAPGAGLVRATGISADGKIAATVDMPDGSRHAFLYDGRTMIDLGTMGGNSSEAAANNAHGHVVGWARFGDHTRAFLYDGTMHDLGTLGGADAQAFGINDGGQVTGRAATADGVSRGFLYQGGSMKALHSPGTGAGSAGWTINAAGQVGGDYAALDNAVRGFLGGVCDCAAELGTLGGRQSSVVALNDGGQAAGASDTRDGKRHAFVVKGGKMRDLGTFGGASSYAAAINASGRVAGYADTAGGDRHAFVYDGAALKALGTLGGNKSQATAINAAGQVVGFATTTDGFPHAILWTESEGLVDLNTRIPGAPAGTVLNVAYAVSDNGSIVAGANSGLVLLKVHAP
jgi:probable HAF family extracellular repeat protein